MTERDSLLSLRTALILLTAVVSGLVVGGLAFLAYGNAAAAVLAGLTAGGSSVSLLQKNVGRE